MQVSQADRFGIYKRRYGLSTIDRGSAGGLARAEKLSPQERSEIARKAASERWGVDIPKANYTGEIKIGDKVIACAVLDDGTRLINQATFMVALGRAARAKGGTGASVSTIPPFLSAKNLRPFITAELEEKSLPIRYTTSGGGKAYGFRADILADVCEVYLDAQEQGQLLRSQEQAAAAASMLIRGMARVGITALVDEATGYEVNRERQALQKLFEQYIEERFRPWIKQFPDEFFKEVYRIHGWAYNENSSKRPSYIGKFINAYIYDALPSVAVKEIERRNAKNAKGNRAARHHQFLTQHTGVPALDRQIASVITLMRASDDKAGFKRLYERAFPPAQQQLELQLDVD